MTANERAAIRSFVAVDLDPAVLLALRRVQDDLRHAGGDVRWVRPEGLHVTLKFLGLVEAQRLDEVHAAVAAAVRNQPPLTVVVRGLGAFPNLRRPRVLWAGLEGDDLGVVARRIDAALVTLGFAAESRGFNPHVTLGRINGLKGWAALEKQIETHRADHFGVSAVADVHIYRSVPQAGGSVYTLLRTIALTAGAMDNSAGRK